MNKEILEMLRQNAQDSIEEGAWRFGPKYPATDQRIPSSSLFIFAEAWANMLVDLLQEKNIGALLGLSTYKEPEVRWIPKIAQILARRGIELPVTELDEEHYLKSGTPLTDYPYQFPITVFTDINTTGGMLEQLKSVAGIYRLNAINAVALIDRYPTPTTKIKTMTGEIPFYSVLHLPLSLYESPTRTKPGFPIERTEPLFS